MTRPTENILIRHATLIAIAAVTVLTMATVFVLDRQSETGAVSRGWVNHTYDVKNHIQMLLNRLEDAQVSQRGYLISGQEEFLEPYQAALRHSSFAAPGPQSAAQQPAPEEDLDGLKRLTSDDPIQQFSAKEELNILKELTADNPVQQQNIAEAAGDVDQFFDYLAATIDLRRNDKDGGGLQKIDLRSGKELMDKIRNIVRIMTMEENQLLTLRIQRDEDSRQRNNLIVYCSIALFYVILVLAIWVYQRSRQRAQAELMRYMTQLENSEEELKIQQEELKASNEEIEASNEELEEQNAQIKRQSEDLARSKKLIEQKATEVEQASKYKSEFLANMSHELRTPLNSLLILAKSLAGNEDGNLTESQIEEARIIHNDGLELMNLINDILDLSKVEAGKLTIIAEDILLDSAIKRLQQQFAPVAKEKNIAFLVDIANDLPATLHTDTQRMEQILKNLLANAFKFTSKGSVTLKIHHPDAGIEIQRATLDADNAIAFSIIDTGIGIESSRLKDIFEAFQQENGSIDRHYGGTGLGLTIARKFAHLLGGEIHVASEKGQGSRFTLIVPIILTVQNEEGKTAPSLLLTRHIRAELKPVPQVAGTEFIADDRKNIGDNDKILLVIEDDRNFATILMKIARKRGYKCLAAGDGKTGLLLAIEQPVTAIILDLKLPDIDGMQVLEQLKHDLRSRHIPVHIMSGRDESDTVISMRQGAVGYLTKPVAEEGIDNALSKIETLLKEGIKQVLVIEDDSKNRIAIQELLKKKDIEITSAPTGAAALDQLKQTAFDCVILDLHLPDISGFEWLEQAEQQSGAAGLPPVIVYTARQLTEDENRQLHRYTGSIIIKGAQSPERLLDEVTLFLHSVESTLSTDQRAMIRMQHDPDKVLQGKTALLADDDLRNTFALSKLLKKHGMNVVIADNGQMALDKLGEDAAIDLVIMDIMMPVMDGYQAIREIRKQNQYKDLPIIALTARAMPEEQEKCLAAGANDYLTKPVDIERLLMLLRVWLFKQDRAA